MSDKAQEEAAFLARWGLEESFYAAWGDFVADALQREIEGRVAPVRLDMFLRIPARPRVKGTDSLLQKAFYRKKAYRNPYDEIEDKVGLRFVVLLAEDVRIVEQAILAVPDWDAEKARDYAQELEAKPYEFDYQSVHYVVRPRLPTTVLDQTIPVGTPCEVQIRTLLQHAYSELTHDTIYKPSVKATPRLKRTAAKSMALIEATSDYFSAVSGVIQHELDSVRRLGEFILAGYARLVGPTAGDTPLNSLLLDHYRSFVPDDFVSEFEKWAAEKAYVFPLVRERAKSSVLYRTPSILLVYFAIALAPRAAAHNSPLSDDELQPVYSDMGLALYG